VPANWTITPLKGCFTIYGGSTPKSDEAAFWDGEIVWVSPADLSKLSTLYINDSARKITDAGLSSCGTKLVPEGSIVLSTRAPIGSLAIAKTELCTNQGCKSLVPKAGVDELFYAYCLLASTEALNLRGKGTTFLELSADELGAFKVPLPPFDEQAAVAAFLNRETGKIDILIAEQEKLLALLAEKRQATISHTVTRGLNPDAPMRDSGYAWMSLVPAHWAVAGLGYIASVENGTTPSRDVEEYWRDGNIPWLASGEVNQLHIRDATEYITDAALKNCSLRLLPVGTVIVGMIGQGKTRGMSARLLISATINQNLAAICPGPRMDGGYLLYVFHAVYEWLREAGRGGNQAAMNCQMLSSLRIPVPPIEEQRAILDFIEAETTRLDALKAEVERGIELLRERRSALVSAAVTGKIDVRNAVPEELAA